MHFRSHQTGNIVWVTQIGYLGERHMHVMSQIWNRQCPRPMTGGTPHTRQTANNHSLYRLSPHNNRLSPPDEPTSSVSFTISRETPEHAERLKAGAVFYSNLQPPHVTELQGDGVYVYVARELKSSGQSRGLGMANPCESRAGEISNRG